MADVATNYWEAGFRNFVAGSFFSNLNQYAAFREHLNADAETYVIHLCAGKLTRDQRRIDRSKPSTKEWRDHVDSVDPEDQTLATDTDSYRYLRIDNDGLSVEETVEVIRAWAPELFED
ncbi:MAG: hypothetical protein M9953_06670 [Thermomicrobiales bacterium]|nr:hypothetical protein [Thermomicrobiales bacterium]MCO5217286.1 hypothetical protein [Thermomicrobiales bacterium]MCO5225002.1 hypothetical protein [Thermomicrobiales bacterium]